jgi:hypothetical protein
LLLFVIMRSTAASRALTKVALLASTLPLALACGSPADSSPATTSGSKTTTVGIDGGVQSGGSGSGSGGGVVTLPDGGTTTIDGGAGSDDAGPPLPVLINYVPNVVVSTLAGSSASGTQDGTGAAAQFNNPTGGALDANGNLVVADYGNNAVRLVTPAGVVTTIASGTGFVDPFAAVVATDGKYYFQTDADPTGTKGTSTGTIWLVTPVSGGLATPTVVAQGMQRPRGLAPIAGGNLFVADRTENVVETLTVASGQLAAIAGANGVPGYVDGTGSSAEFNGPVGAASLPDGSFLVPDAGNNRIRHVTTAGVVTTYAGNGSPTLVDGTCAAASFNAPRGVAVDSAGINYGSDIGNHVIRQITPDCTVATLAGIMTEGFNDGPGSTAQFYGQEGIAVTADGKTLYVVDGNGGDGSAYNRVRTIAIP